MIFIRLAIMATLCMMTIVPATAGTSGVVSGFVRTEDGVPLPRTEVRLQSRTQMLSTRTDSRGFFSFLAVDPDHVVMYLERPGYSPRSFLDYVSADANVRWSIELQKCFECWYPPTTPRGPMQNPLDVYTFDAAALKEFFP